MMTQVRSKSGKVVLMQVAKTKRGFNKRQKALKAQVREMITLGKSDEEILAFVVLWKLRMS